MQRANCIVAGKVTHMPERKSSHVDKSDDREKSVTRGLPSGWKDQNHSVLSMCQVLLLRRQYEAVKFYSMKKLTMKTSSE
jgi:hypothetical protein